MKKQVFVYVLAAMMSACDHSHDPKATAENTLPEKIFYGVEFDPASATEASKVPSAMEGVDSLNVIVSGKIIETCAKAGCWMTLDIGQDEPMWIYTGHEFFVPTTGCAGLTCKVKGIARKEVQTVDAQKHYAEDANRSAEEIAAITAEKSVYSIDATGIMIEGYKGDTAEGHEGHDHENHDHDGDGVQDHGTHEHEGTETTPQ